MMRFSRGIKIVTLIFPNFCSISFENKFLKVPQKNIWAPLIRCALTSLFPNLLKISSTWRLLNEIAYIASYVKQRLKHFYLNFSYSIVSLLHCHIQNWPKLQQVCYQVATCRSSNSHVRCDRKPCSRLVNKLQQPVIMLLTLSGCSIMQLCYNLF